ncbi:MAG: nucleotidyltransferase domain-containing protein [Deltaproteobacteria bacterium]|nr:nucleotidyltransferase domain-containing protein [Deltaproteobacteria bacterium]
MRQTFNNILNCLLDGCLDVYGDHLVSLAVFGSVAAATMRPDSDIDVLLVCDQLPHGRMARIRQFEAVDSYCQEVLEQASRQGVMTCFSPHIKTPREVRLGSPLFLDMTETVKILFDRQGFLEQYLQGLKQRLAHLGAQRVMFGGGYYWLLKPDLEPGEAITL